jgi:hypothetical protein
MSHANLETTMGYINMAGQIATWRQSRTGESAAATAHRQARFSHLTGL